MPDTRAEIKKQLDELVEDGDELLLLEHVKHLLDAEPVPGNIDRLGDDLKKEARELKLAARYQTWYSRALRVVEQLLPDRYPEFRAFYRPEKPPKALDVTTYTVSHYLAGISVTRGALETVNPFGVFKHAFGEQLNIVRSAADRLESRLSDITGVLEAQLFDDELEIADELRKKKHLRAAGVVAGVVLERHLKRVAASHSVRIRKKKPSIGDLNDALKNGDVYDTVAWGDSAPGRHPQSRRARP